MPRLPRRRPHPSAPPLLRRPPARAAEALRLRAPPALAPPGSADPGPSPASRLVLPVRPPRPTPRRSPPPPRPLPLRPPPRRRPRSRRPRPMSRRRGLRRSSAHPPGHPWMPPRQDDPASPSPDRARGVADRLSRRRPPPSRPGALPVVGPPAGRAHRPVAAIGPRSVPAPAVPSLLRRADRPVRPPAGRSRRRRGWADVARRRGRGHRRAQAAPGVAVVPPGPAPAGQVATEVPDRGVATEAVVPGVGWGVGRCRRPRPDEAAQVVAAARRSVGPVVAGATWRSSSRPS